MKSIVHKIILLIIVVAVINTLAIFLLYHFVFTKDRLADYGDGYNFAVITIGSGKCKEIYVGCITNEDLNKWVNQEASTIHIYSSLKSRIYSYRVLSVYSITGIRLYDKKDNLPLNFYIGG